MPGPSISLELAVSSRRCVGAVIEALMYSSLWALKVPPPVSVAPAFRTSPLPVVAKITLAPVGTFRFPAIVPEPWIVVVSAEVVNDAPALMFKLPM